MRDDDLDVARDRHDLIQENLRILGAVIRAASRSHVHENRRVQAIREREQLLNSREMLGIAQADAAVAEVDL